MRYQMKAEQWKLSMLIANVRQPSTAIFSVDFLCCFEEAMASS